MSNFTHIRDKVHACVRLSPDEGVELFRHPNLLEVGALANVARERLHGDRAYFNVNMHLNATNVCEASCRFCAFARQPDASERSEGAPTEPGSAGLGRSRAVEGSPGAYTMTLDEALARVAARADQPITEIHIVNGLHPGLPFSYYEELLRGIKRLRPALHIKAFTAVEIEYFAHKFGMTRHQVLERLVDCGLGSLPGGGAEIFAERARRKICADKVDTAGWIDIHQTAHRMGLKSNCTMLYGHIETEEERVHHLVTLREAQDETGGFQCFVPLAFHPANTALAMLPPPTGVDDLRVYAVSRLMLDNIPHVKAYWTMVGQKTAQVALWFGADDADGTVEEERIYHMAGARTPQALTRAELVRMVRAAGREPVERDTLYNVVRSEPPVAEQRRLRVLTVEQPS